MIREDKHLISHSPYAVDLSSLEIQTFESRQRQTTRYRGEITAVWFRRKNGSVAAHIGKLWDYQDQETEPVEAATFLARHEDGRYGGQCLGRWDGESFWGNIRLAQQEEFLAILRPMLDNYPNLPPGFSGWWTFKTGDK